ncbi:MAG: hypothetical protein K0S61_3935 [Anaerocolumna sp.]|jgi:predicted transcriptional regulator|nr:hypothetical protein [Anaerocolumna sp.]
MNVLLSIKPEFVERIFDGSKKFEYRRKIFKRVEIKKVIIYATSPISKVVGEFEIDEIYFDSINKLWNRTKDLSGINKTYYERYFSGLKFGYAIKIKSAIKYDIALSIQEKYHINAPQSFVYVQEGI